MVVCPQLQTLIALQSDLNQNLISSVLLDGDLWYLDFSVLWLSCQPGSKSLLQLNPFSFCLIFVKHVDLTKILNEVENRPGPIIFAKVNDPFLICCNNLDRFLGKMFVTKTTVSFLSNSLDSCRHPRQL